MKLDFTSAFLLLFLLGQTVFNRLANRVVVIGEQGVDSHVKEVVCLSRLVRPEHVTANAVRVCLVDHFLIEVGLVKLYFFSSKLDRTVNDLPRARLQVTNANRDIGSIRFELTDMLIGLQHEVNVTRTIVFANECHDLFMISSG